MSSQDTHDFYHDLSWSALSGAALSFVDAEWIERTQHPVLMRWLAESRRTRAFAARQLREDFQLEPLPVLASEAFPANILRRGPVFLKKFVFHIGLIGYSEIVRRSIDGRFKRHFWSLVGEDGYVFASKRAVLYNPGLIVRCVPPLQTGDSFVTELDINVVGLRVLTAVLKQNGEALIRRVNLMFPIAVVSACRQVGAVEVDERELSILTRMMLKLCTELGESS